MTTPAIGPVIKPDIDPALCPLCTQPNSCALVEGGKSCWCFQANILESARDSIPIEADGLACVCFRCGTGEHAVTVLPLPA